jgi:LAS superfamily LD-carboxypeptidase LdcB
MPEIVLADLELTGKARTHVVQAVDLLGACIAATPDVVEAFWRMQRAASQDGFDLTPYSAFRDFRTQKRIWNRKYEGRKPLFDEAGTPLDRAGLVGHTLIRAILYWSALSGESRRP